MENQEKRKEKTRPIPKSLSFWESHEAMSVTTSIAVHAALIILLLLLVYHLPPTPLGDALIGGFDRAWDALDLSPAAQVSPAINTTASGATSARAISLPQENIVDPTAFTFDALLDAARAAMEAESSSANTASIKINDAFGQGGGFAGRSGDYRGHCREIGETTGASEEAVEAALAWLARHQCPRDGGWSFKLDHESHCDLCRCACQNGGTHGSRVAATSLALLAFLGAGQTSREGNYQRVVERGFNYLLEGSKPRTRDETIDFSQDVYPQRYINALAALALSEGYAMNAMTDSEKMKAAAQGVINYIVKAQNPRDGGWGYSPTHKVRSDISITGWQIMALKSGRLAELNVRQETLYNASRFLDKVQFDGGRRYRYLVNPAERGIGDGSAETCTAIGLLLRQYFGLRAGDASLDGGMKIVTDWNTELRADVPSNLFQHYYAALALHHYGSSQWKTWYVPLRESLVRTQSRRGHESGSWYFPNPHYGDVGGRLLNTALAAMILEVPYRYLPLYREVKP